MQFTFRYLCWCSQNSIHFILIYWKITWDNEHRWISHVSGFGMVMKVGTLRKIASHERGTQGQVKTSTGPNTNDLRHLDSDSASDTPSTFATSKGLAEKGYQGLSDPHVVISLRDKITYLNSVFSIAC